MNRLINSLLKMIVRTEYATAAAARFYFYKAMCIHRFLPKAVNQCTLTTVPRLLKYVCTDGTFNYSSSYVYKQM